MLTTREVIKTFYNALLQRLKKHRGDWNQNDPSADDYIKNRPFYTDETKKVVKLDKKYLPNEALTGVKTVNGIEPDDTGNVAVEIPAGGVQTVNGVAPDENGNVNVVYKNIDETVHIPIPTDWSMADEWDKADVSLTPTPDYIYKVSDEVPELTYVKTVKETIRMFGGKDSTYIYSEESEIAPIYRGDGIMWAGHVAMAARAGELTYHNTVMEQNITYSYPSAGIYIKYNPQNDTGLKSASYHLCAEKIGIYLNSLSGKEFMITVDDSGALTTEAVTE